MLYGVCAKTYLQHSVKSKCAISTIRTSEERVGEASEVLPIYVMLHFVKKRSGLSACYRH